jgi:hypothetical protein
MQLAQLAEELQASPAACAAFAQHYPQQLLQEPHAAAGIQQQLQTLAQAAGVRIGALLEELDPDQSKGLAALLLYEAGWISAQLRKLTTLVQELLGEEEAAVATCRVATDVSVWLRSVHSVASPAAQLTALPTVQLTAVHSVHSATCTFAVCHGAESAMASPTVQLTAL